MRFLREKGGRLTAFLGEILVGVLLIKLGDEGSVYVVKVELVKTENLSLELVVFIKGLKSCVYGGDKVVVDIETAFNEALSELPTQWNELSSRLQAVSNFRTKDVVEAISQAQAFVEGIGAVASASDDAINVMSTYSERLSIDVKNIYGDAFTILCGLFGEEGNKDHSVLNQYEGTMNLAPETMPDYGYVPDPEPEPETDHTTNTEADINAPKDNNNTNLDIIITCVLSAISVAVIVVTVLLVIKKKNKST